MKIDINLKIFLPAVILWLFVIATFFLSISHSEEIDLKIIAKIESSNNPNAYNSKTQAIGLYQITPICLADYNQFHDIKFTLKEMFNPTKCHMVAYWYLNIRIPKMLKHYNKPITIKNILICYNVGIKYSVKNLTLPNETNNYIKKYLTQKGG